MEGTQATTDRFDDPAVVSYLREGGRETTYREGEIILHRGDPGRAFFVILAGEVEIRIEDEEGRTLPLTRMSAGSSFGEMALLRGMPVSADVAALSEVTVLEYPGEDFQRALTECEALRLRLLTRLADNLQQTTTEAWEFFQRAEALRALSRSDDHPAKMVASSAKLRALEKRIRKVASDDRPVLISGEAGTGKLLAARMVHGTDEGDASPMIVVDCRPLEAHEARKLIFGTTQLGSVSDSSAGFGAVHLAHGGTLVLHHADALEAEVQRDVIGLIASAGEALPFPKFRLVVTSRNPDEQPPESLIGEVRHRGDEIRMPRLAECRKDIVPLARHFLEDCGSAKSSDLSISARHAVVSMRYRHRNMAELRETIQLAALCADGDEIRAEHIFTAPGEGMAPGGFNLGEVGFLRRWVLGRSLGVSRGVVTAGFLAVIALCLVAPATAAGRAANTLIWSGWEPVVFGLFLVIGRVWCTLCPLSVVARISKRLIAFERPPPRWLESSWVWIATLGFLLIVWSERVFHMTSNPVASGFLLVALLVLPAIFTMIYQREVWCRHLCPLGTLGAALTPPSPLHLEANSSVCASTCTTHECFKGSETVPGCTVFHHPLDGSEAHMCKLCMDCLKSCPHQSARVYLQAPLVGVWRLGTNSAALAPFLLAIFLLSPVLLAVQGTGWITGAVPITVATVLAVVCGGLMSYLLPIVLHGGEEEDSPVPARVAFALMILGWGPLMAYQFGNIHALSAFHLGSEPRSLLATVAASGQLTLLPLAQLAIVALAAVLAAITLWRIRVRADHDGDLIAWGGWTLLLLGCAIYLVIVVFLILSG
jgi:CRP-like cAMP-binding protein